MLKVTVTDKNLEELQNHFFQTQILLTRELGVVLVEQVYLGRGINPKNTFLRSRNNQKVRLSCVILQTEAIVTTLGSKIFHCKHINPRVRHVRRVFVSSFRSRNSMRSPIQTSFIFLRFPTQTQVGRFSMYLVKKRFLYEYCKSHLEFSPGSMSYSPTLIIGFLMTYYPSI